LVERCGDRLEPRLDTAKVVMIFDGLCSISPLVLHDLATMLGMDVAPFKVDTGEVEFLPILFQYARSTFVKGSRELPLPKMTIGPLPSHWLLVG